MKKPRNQRAAQAMGAGQPGGRIARSKPRWLRGILLLLPVLLALAWWGWPAQKQTALPELDLRSMDPKVAAVIAARREEVLRHPRSSEAWGWLGALLWAYDLRPAAGCCLAQAAALDPRNPRWPYYHALALIIATPNQAIPLLAQTVRLCGSSPPAPRFRLAYLLAEQGRWAEARRELDPLLAEHPRFTPALLLAARDWHRRGELDQAIPLARACIDDARTARSALVLLATLHRQKGDPGLAAQVMEKVGARPPDQGFEDPYQAEVTLLRGDARALSEQAHPLLAAGLLPEAAALIDQLERVHPDNPETWLLAGRLRLLRKELPAAEQMLARHLEMAPRSGQGLFQLGLVYLAQERWTNAAAVFTRAITIKPDFGPAHFNRGVALARAGDLRTAIEAIQESLRHNPERMESYLFLADLHLRRGERHSASALLDQAEFLYPNDPRLRGMRGRAQGRSP